MYPPQALAIIKSISLRNSTHDCFLIQIAVSERPVHVGSSWALRAPLRSDRLYMGLVNCFSPPHLRSFCLHRRSLLVEYAMTGILVERCRCLEIGTPEAPRSTRKMRVSMSQIRSSREPDRLTSAPYHPCLSAYFALPDRPITGLSMRDGHESTRPTTFKQPPHLFI